MQKRTVISGIILLALICLLVALSVIISGFWVKYLSHWIILPVIALITTLLTGLVLMDEIFELDDPLVITLKNPGLKIEIRKYLVWAFLIVCAISIALEVVQFFISSSTASWLDPLTAIAGSVFGIIVHIIGSRWLMKRVEFELDRWESNVL